MDLFELVKNKKDDILKLAKKHGAYNVRIFGSVAKGEAREDSDIDFLVEFQPHVGLLEWSGFWVEMEDLLGHKVDIATEKVLKDRIKNKILQEAKPL